uniref:Uncharacterized protein n=1 Tax=Biomphalaria glabrata TaxID=6526 RepID=A0A2C9LW31_BIOGL
MASLAQPAAGKKAQDRQMEKIQQQLLTLEKQNAEKILLMDRLEQLSRMDTERTQRVLERASSSNRTLKDEIERVYGPDENSPRNVNNKIVHEIIAKRTQDFERSKAEKALHMQLLVQERLKILEARDRLRAKKEVYRSLPSPIGNNITVIEMAPRGRSSGHRSVHSGGSYVKKAIESMPDAMDRIWNLRDSLHDDYVKKRKPYAGELGIASYLPRQIPSYLLVRKLVEDFVDNFIVTNIPPDHQVQKKDLKRKKLNEKEKDWEKTSKLLTERAAVQLVAEELLLEVTSSMTKDIASEGIHQDLLFKRMSANMFIREAEAQATGDPRGRDPNDPAYDLITRTFYTLQKNRDNFKKHIWMHSQLTKLSGPPPPQIIQIVTPPVKTKKKKKVNIPPEAPVSAPKLTTVVHQPMEADVQLITYDHLHPVDLKSSDARPTDGASIKKQKFWNDVYERREAKYWSKLKPDVFILPMARRCLGVTAIRPSPDHMQLAVGMKSGDVVVYNTQVHPWRIVKIDCSQEADGHVVHLAWSLDSSRLLAVKYSGTVTVWLTIGHPASKEHLRLMELTANETRVQPFSLLHLHTFNAAQGDLTLTEGPLVEQGSSRGQEKATLAAFFPSLTLFTTQHSVCTALQNGDVLKLDLETANTDTNLHKSPILLKPKIQTNVQVPNLVRQKIEAELLREHKHPIIHLDFVGNIGKMITVDRSGLICLWKYDKAQLSGFDWFLPEKKYQLKMSKISYAPSPEGIYKVLFTDRKGRTAHQGKIAQERKQAQRDLIRMNLSDPWHVVHGANELDTYIYEPPGGARNTTSVFHIVVRHRKTQQLSSYKTFLFQPVQVKCSRLLVVKQTPSGNNLVFILLFPAQSPKSPHLTILVLDLQTMKLHNIRKDLDITVEEHDTLNEVKIFSADVTQTYGPTGSEYLFITLNGRLSCISLNTGALTLCLDSLKKPQVPRFSGLRVNKKLLTLTKYYQVASIGNFGALHAIMFDRDTPQLTVLKLEDENLPEETRQMTKAYQLWGGKSCPSELRVNPVDCSLPDMKHKEAEMRSLILSLLPPDEELSIKDREKEKNENYLSLTQKVRKQALLSDL